MDYVVREAGDEQLGCPFSGGRIVRTIGRETGDKLFVQCSEVVPSSEVDIM